MSKKNQPMTPKDFAFIEALCSSDPRAMEDFMRSQGCEMPPDLPVNLNTIPKEQWEPLTKVFPTPGMQRYLDTEDILTPHTVEMMELALEKTYGVVRPWAIVAECTGTEAANNIKVDHFYLEFFSTWKPGDDD